MRGARWVLGAVLPLLISVGTAALANQPPVVNAGPDQTVFVREVTMLEGSATDDDDDSIVDWLWAVESQPDGSIPNVWDAVSPDSMFDADVAGDYVLSLIASDGTDWSEPDFVIIHVIANQPPVAIATADVTCGYVSLEVHFEGSQSYDPEGGPLQYSWTYDDGSPSEYTVSVIHTFEGPSTGTHLVRFRVNDDKGQSGDAFIDIGVCAASEPDADSDGVCDTLCDNCTDLSNPDQLDTDADGIGDDCDTCPLDPENDIDNDGICGDVDSCPYHWSVDAMDADGDGVDDVCDTCVDVENPDQADADGDEVGDVCDTCTDTDGDGYGDPGFPINTCPTDNCPDDWNDDQLNGDGDPAGDVCDCAPSDPDTWPGAPETNDGQENQCPVEPGYGMIDEVSGTLGFFNPNDKTEVSWSAQPGATWYQAARSEEPEFLAGCLRLATSETLLRDDEDLPSGGVYYYLVRSLLPHAGSWGDRSSGERRLPACTAIAEVFSFVDTAGDDVAATALYDWFDGLGVTTSDHILFELRNETEVHAWCSERADFYRDTYLARALTGGSESSGTWAKWHRGPATGGSWSEPDYGAYTNHYSSACYDAYSWCSETTLGGLYLMVNPNDTGQLEAVDFLTSFCITEDCQLTIIIGDTRWDACGF